MKFLLGIFAWIYTMVIAIRHRLYDWGVFKSYSFDIPIICVGNITVGGTGKTPTVEYLISILSSDYTIAVLSRGYGRRTKGYREVQTSDSYLDVGDEPLQMKLKSPGTVVVVSEDRVAGVERLRKEHPEVSLIIMDDGFQHRRVKAKVNVILIDSTRPVEEDSMLPLGRLRDLKSRLKAAHIFIVTKCNKEMAPLDKRLWTNKLRFVAYQKIYFSTIESRRICPLFSFSDREEVNYGQQAILLSGIGNPRPFVREAEVRFNVVDKMLFPDHHDFSAEDMRALYEKLKRNPRAVIIMTEKDAVRLRRSKLPEPLMRAMYFLPIQMAFFEGPDTDMKGNLIAEIKYTSKPKKSAQGAEPTTEAGDNEQKQFDI
uniref:tetraacyldisaccharide 4'-kinase n=1 Tax=Alistipes sp. TaxID=1872444 RepID=UPI004057C168